MRRRSRAVDRLLAQLGDSDPAQRRQAVEALERLSFKWDRRPRPAARQIDQVFRALSTMVRRDPDPGVRHAAAYALTFWFEPRAPAALLPALEDTGELSNIRGQAAEGLGNVLDNSLGSRFLRGRAIAALRRGLADPSAEVRFWCLYALGTMRATEARAEIEQIAATDEGICPYMWRVCHEAADVLAYWAEGTWPDRDFDPAARPSIT